MHNTFSKDERLCGELRVAELFAKGENIVAWPLRACWCMTERPMEHAARIQVLMSVPKKKLHRANKRNRVKRLLRESYRLQKHSLVALAESQDKWLQIAFVWIPQELCSYGQVSAKMMKIIDKIQNKLQANETCDSVSD